MASLNPFDLFNDFFVTQIDDLITLKAIKMFIASSVNQFYELPYDVYKLIMYF